MHGLRTLIVLLVILAGLGGYVYFVERERDPLASDREQAFGEVASDQIEEIRITSADGETSRLQKTGSDWKLVEPVQADADQSEAASIASSLASITVQRVVEENPGDLKQYGLDPARMEIGFRTKGQTGFRRILLGEKTPTGGDLYAKLPEQPRVFLVASYLESTFNKNTFALRDKRILRFERDKVDGLELASGAAGLQFSKSDSEWRLVKPIAARADFGTVEGAVERLASAQMQGIVASDTEDLRRYGLDRPTATFSVLMGSSRATLMLGRTENALVYAKDASRPMIFTVAPTLQTDLIKDVSEYRRKDLFDSRSFTTTRIEITRAGTTVAFEKTRAGDKDVWKDAAGKELDTAKVEDLLTKITGLRAASFESSVSPSLKSPDITVTVRFDDGKKSETVRFGRAGSDVVAARADEPGTAKLDASSYDEAVKALDALK